MSDITVTSKGDWESTAKWLNTLKDLKFLKALDHFGQEGVNALQTLTPVDTGKTAASWTYEIERGIGYYSITWHNTNVVDGKPVAILLQYGHGTGTGGYVVGRDYVNPAVHPIFDRMIDEMIKEVNGA